MCKGAIQRFVETFFEQSILLSSFNLKQKQQPIPIVLKYVFDFLDIQASQSQVKLKLILYFFIKKKKRFQQLMKHFIHGNQIVGYLDFGNN
jgi:hypothetical protein